MTPSMRMMAPPWTDLTLQAEIIIPVVGMENPAIHTYSPWLDKDVSPFLGNRKWVHAPFPGNRKWVHSPFPGNRKWVLVLLPVGSNPGVSAHNNRKWASAQLPMALAFRKSHSQKKPALPTIFKRTMRIRKKIIPTEKRTTFVDEHATKRS